MSDITQEAIESGDTRENPLFKRIMKEQLEEYSRRLESNDPSDHIGFVKAQTALVTLRIFQERILAPSEISYYNEEE